MNARNLRQMRFTRGKSIMTIKPALPLVMLCGLLLAACGSTESNIPDNSWEVRNGPQQIPLSAPVHGGTY